MIKFKHDTLVKEYKHVNFPKTMFWFKTFEAILSKQEIDEKVLIDVIGRLVEIYSPQEKVIAGKMSRLIDFVLEDNSYTSNRTPLRCIDSASRLGVGVLSIAALAC
nr:replication protein A 70 kDa DNA-binding subunit B-like [Ipomoea batatas]